MHGVKLSKTPNNNANVSCIGNDSALVNKSLIYVEYEPAKHEVVVVQSNVTINVNKLFFLSIVGTPVDFMIQYTIRL